MFLLLDHKERAGFAASIVETVIKISFRSQKLKVVVGGSDITFTVKSEYLLKILIAFQKALVFPTRGIIILQFTFLTKASSKQEEYSESQESLSVAFKEIRRVLKPGGKLLLVNELRHGTTPEKVIEETHVKLFSLEETQKLLQSAGFVDVQVFTKAESPWNAIITQK